jgi:small multidrug resistance pump
LLAFALRHFPVGVAYAMWSGMGIVFIAMIGFAVFGQKLDLAAILGIALILVGILVINLFSNTATH